ncbi:MAG: hypothetical protein KAI97_05735, partial [Gemmatimonadetes bacterium]|nr:hypothetical protein [Gemmatimonadota bacterium]
MRRRLTTLFVLSTAVVSVLLLGVHGGSPWPDAITLISDHGVRGGIASDRTRQALRELVYPRGIPDGASHYFVSSEEGGWFPRGAIKAAGTPLDPLRDFVAVQEIIDHGAGPLFFEFDPADNFEHNPANGKGFFRQPDHTGGCGDTGVVCWTFASADRTGVQTPTFSCSDHSVIPVGDGFFENDTDDALALVNIRIRCPATPDEDLKPVFYAEGL